MELIAANTRVNAKPSGVLAALTTTDGFRRWWTDDAEVGCDIGAPAIFRFGTSEVTFLIDRIDRQGIEMTCVAHKNYAEWAGHAPHVPGDSRWRWRLRRRASRRLPRQKRLLCPMRRRVDSLSEEPACLL